MRVQQDPQSAEIHEAAIDDAYATTAVLALIAHAADSINSGSVHPADAQKLARDIRRSAELAEEMVSGILSHLETGCRSPG